MATIWDPKKRIRLFTTPGFPSTWKTIIDKPYPGILVGVGWLHPDWINTFGHQEREYQECFIYHWPKEAVPAGLSARDRVGDVMAQVPGLITSIGKMLPEGGEKVAELVNSALAFSGSMFTALTNGPLKDLPMLNLLNPDGSLTFIYAHWYEGTPTNFQWVLDFNYTRIKQLTIWNRRVHELEEAPAEAADSARLAANLLETEESFSNNGGAAAQNGDLRTASLLNTNTVADPAEFPYQSVQGILEPQAGTDPAYPFSLSHTSSGNELLKLKSGAYDLDLLHNVPYHNVVNVMGTVQEEQGSYSMTVDSLGILKTSDVIHIPMIDAGEESFLSFLSAPAGEMQARAAATCPADIQKKIRKEVEDIKRSSEKLKTIQWQKYATIGISAATLIGTTLSTAIGILSTVTAPPAALACAILVSKITTLASTVTSLSNLDGWARAELQVLQKSKANLESYKKSYPACFK